MNPIDMEVKGLGHWQMLGGLGYALCVCLVWFLK